MRGPDSASWPANADEDEEWNWQSGSPCDEVGALIEEGAGDERLLAVVARYTVENLILNAVHEIGEWLRFDGQRLFPAHLPRTRPLADADGQGNGAVQLRIAFPSEVEHTPGASEQSAASRQGAPPLLRRLAEIAAGPRFTYLPDTTISFEAAGPVIRGRPGCGTSDVWRSTWSASTVEAVDAPKEELILLAGQDVHRALVFFEASRICRAFHVDGRRPWRVVAPEPTLGANPTDEDARSTPITILVSYAINLLKPIVSVENFVRG